MFEYFVTKTNKIYLSAVKQRKSHLLSNKLTWAFFSKRLLHQPFWQGALLQRFYY